MAGLAFVPTAGTSAAANIDDLVPRNLRVTFSGSYLAGLVADMGKDIGNAVDFYGNAAVSDPRNPSLLDRLLLLSLADGEFDQAFSLAVTLSDIDPSNAMARTTLGARSIAGGDYEAAIDQLADLSAGPIATLFAGLLTAWAEFGEGDTDRALATIESLEGPNWYSSFKEANTAFILDAAGRQKEAAAAIARAYETDRSLPVMSGLIRILARAGKPAEAIDVVVTAGDAALDPSIQALRAAIEAGEDLGPAAPSAEFGAAEALYHLGSALGTSDGPERPAAYLRLASFLNPQSAQVTLDLGRVYEASGRCEEAIALYRTIPDDEALRPDADIRTGICLAALEQTDEAAQHLTQVIEADPSNIGAAIELGNVYRWAERYSEAADAYTVAIDAITQPNQDDWRVFYFRGVSNFFSDAWPVAEADFKHALELSPDQPDVLNFLGYSWVDMGLNLEEALGMIRRAVDLRPQSGYIVDSLGWAYFRLGRYDEAVVQLERAIELQSTDSTLNDHLGDAYWMVGRKHEAMFQWAHARDFVPENDAALERILRKLEVGLDAADIEAPAEAPPG